jgi:glycosyltransferase involved in cell wall biosynthesis
VKIIHIISGLSAGGAERALYNLLAGGLAQRFENAVISLRDEGAYGRLIRALDVQVHALHIGKGVLPLRALNTLRNALERIQPGIIQGWMYHGNVAASVAAMLAPRQPVVAWNIRHSLYDLEHEKRLTRWVIRANRFLSSRTAAILYNSYVARCQHEAFGYSSAHGRVIPNGFDLRCFRSDAEVRRQVRAEIGIPQDVAVVGHVARYHPIKDHVTFLRAAARLVEQKPEVYFLMSGRDVTEANTELAPWLARMRPGRVRMLGERRDAERLMAALDVLCVSSLAEAFPNVIGEAMAAGVPCVTTDVGDSARIVGQTGVVVPPGNEAALAEGLERVISMPAEERKALGGLAQQRIKEKYSIEAAVAQYCELYQAILA